MNNIFIIQMEHYKKKLQTIIWPFGEIGLSKIIDMNMMIKIVLLK